MILNQEHSDNYTDTTDKNDLESYYSDRDNPHRAAPRQIEEGQGEENLSKLVEAEGNRPNGDDKNAAEQNLDSESKLERASIEINKKDLERNSVQLRNKCWNEKDEIKAFDSKGNLIQRIQENIEFNEINFDVNGRTGRSKSVWNLQINSMTDHANNRTSQCLFTEKKRRNSTENTPSRAEKKDKLNLSDDLIRVEPAKRREDARRDQVNLKRVKPSVNILFTPEKSPRPPSLELREINGGRSESEGEDRESVPEHVERAKERPTNNRKRTYTQMVIEADGNQMDLSLRRLESEEQLMNNIHNIDRIIQESELHQMRLNCQMEELEYLYYLEQETHLKIESLREDYNSRFIKAESHY